MSPEAVAGWTLVGYAVLGALLVAWRAGRSPQGWRLWMLYAIAALYARLGFRWRANRMCPFLDARPALVIANHRGSVDPLLIWVGLTNGRPLEFLTAREYFGKPGLQFIFDATRAIPVARDGRDMSATRAALRRLQQGRIVGVFPEGRINTNPGPELLPGDTGVAFLALHSRAPVYPVFIENAPRGRSMVDTCRDFRPVRVYYGDPIDLTAYHGRKTSPELLQVVTALLMRRLADLGNGPFAPTRADDTDRTDILPMSDRSAS